MLCSIERTAPSATSEPSGRTQSPGSSNGDSSVARILWMHYFIARIQPLQLARLLITPHVMGIPLAADSRLDNLACTYLSIESKPVPLESLLVNLNL